MKTIKTIALLVLVGMSMPLYPGGGVGKEAKQMTSLCDHALFAKNLKHPNMQQMLATLLEKYDEEAKKAHSFNEVEENRAAFMQNHAAIEHIINGFVQNNTKSFNNDDQALVARTRASIALRAGQIKEKFAKQQKEIEEAELITRSLRRASQPGSLSPEERREEEHLLRVLSPAPDRPLTPLVQIRNEVETEAKQVEAEQRQYEAKKAEAKRAADEKKRQEEMAKVAKAAEDKRIAEELKALAQKSKIGKAKPKAAAKAKPKAKCKVKNLGKNSTASVKATQVRAAAAKVVNRQASNDKTATSKTNASKSLQQTNSSEKKSNGQSKPKIKSNGSSVAAPKRKALGKQKAVSKANPKQKR